MKDKIVEQVIEKYWNRSERGSVKYGTTLERNNRDNYLQHLQDELMDGSLYLEKMLSLEQEITILVNKHPNDAELGMAIRKLVS